MTAQNGPFLLQKAIENSDSRFWTNINDNEKVNQHRQWFFITLFAWGRARYCYVGAPPLRVSLFCHKIFHRHFFQITSVTCSHTHATLISLISTHYSSRLSLCFWSLSLSLILFKLPLFVSLSLDASLFVLYLSLLLRFIACICISVCFLFFSLFMLLCL